MTRAENHSKFIFEQASLPFQDKVARRRLFSGLWFNGFWDQSKLSSSVLDTKYFHLLISNRTQSNILFIIQTLKRKSCITQSKAHKSGHVQMQTHDLHFLWMAVDASGRRTRNPCGCAISTLPPCVGAITLTARVASCGPWPLPDLRTSTDDASYQTEPYSIPKFV